MLYFHHRGKELFIARIGPWLAAFFVITVRLLLVNNSISYILTLQVIGKDRTDMVDKIRRALYASKIVSYAQVIDHDMRRMSKMSINFCWH